MGSIRRLQLRTKGDEYYDDMTSIAGAILIDSHASILAS